MKLTAQWLDDFQLLDATDENPAGSPPAKKLSYLLRPAFIARRGKTLRWGDWSNIEARVLPWLAGAEEMLDIFRESDADKTKPDIYVRTGIQLVSDGPLMGMTGEEAWAILQDKKHPLNGAVKAMRQAQGKVPVLSLGFGGGLGALQAMAVNYHVYFDAVTGKEVVERWRETNQWAVNYWGKHGRNGSYGLWGAANSAMENPGDAFQAGKVIYVYDRAYLGGTLFCVLPCGRPLAYPGIKWEWREVENKKTGKLEDKYQLTFRKGYARSALWYGKLAENVTQATAASVLRRTLKRLEFGTLNTGARLEDFMPIVMHTHDEVVVECDESMGDAVDDVLYDEMERNDEWDAGLPLKAEVGGGWYYTKAGG